MSSNALYEWPVQEINFSLPLRYLSIEAASPGTVVCLHGYQDHALSMLRRLGWLENSPPFGVLAVNGPFPVPIWNETGFVDAYSWYFRDSARNFVVVAPETTAEKVAMLIHKIVGKNKPIVLFGFSQGGYLAPFLARRLSAVLARWPL